jgi:hypothetical protein
MSRVKCWKLSTVSANIAVAIRENQRTRTIKRGFLSKPSTSPETFLVRLLLHLLPALTEFLSSPFDVRQCVGFTVIRNWYQLYRQESVFAAELLVLLLPTREIPGSSLGPETGWAYPEIFVAFLSPFRQIARYYLKLGNDQSIPYPLHLSICKLSYHSNL